MHKHKLGIFSIIQFFIFLFCFCAAVWAGNSARVLIIPFNINAAKDLSFMQRGVMAMLTTRLTQTGKVDLISLDELTRAGKAAAESMNIDRAISAGKRHKADYVIFGSITVLGDHIDTNAIMVDISQEKPVLAFNRFGQSQSDLFDHITLLATQINEEVFGHKTLTKQEPPQREAKVGIDTQTNKIKPPEPAGATEPSPTIPVPMAESGLVPWASKNFKVRIIGVAVGDLDGDGWNETVFASESKVYIYRHSGEQFAKLGEITNSAQERIIGIDVADINNNGRAEVFVTNFPKKSGRLQSFVLEWDGSGFRKIVDRLNWYFRVMDVPERGHVLLGQRWAGPKAIFSGGVYGMKWSNGQYEPREELKLPRGVNIYSFIFGDALNVGQENLVLFTSLDRVRVLNSNGEEEWISGEKYGTSTIYLEFPSEDISFGDTKIMDRIYLTQRIFVADLNKNGKNEIILVKNLGSTRLFSRVRSFSGGYVEGLEWDGKEFKSVWKSKEFTSGYINDYTIADFNNDGRADELVLAVVGKTSSFSGDRKRKSYIYTQRLDQ